MEKMIFRKNEDFEIGDHVKIIGMGITGEIRSIGYPDIYTIFPDYGEPGHFYQVHKKSIAHTDDRVCQKCGGCIHFELCRSMFGGAGKLPCDFDDYFEARDDTPSPSPNIPGPEPSLMDVMDQLHMKDNDLFQKIRHALHHGNSIININHWIGNAIVVGAIQTECKNLGWHHDVCYNDETKKYVSLVVPPENEKWLDSVEADTAAKAILIAYINAKESLK